MDKKLVLKVFSPRILYSVLRAFDKRTVIVISAFWVVTLVAVFVALLSLWHIGAIKREIAVAEVMEPLLPKITNRVLERSEMERLQSRLQKRFLELTFSVNSDTTITVAANDPARFRLWLTALSYVDTISEYRWSLKDFCVGMACGNNSTPMSATLMAEKLDFVDVSK